MNITRTAAVAATAAVLVAASATLPSGSANARPVSDRLSTTSCQAPAPARPPVHTRPPAPRASDHPPYLARVRWSLG